MADAPDLKARAARKPSLLRRLAFMAGMTLLLSEIALRFVLGNMGQSRIVAPSLHEDICLELQAAADISYTGWYRRVEATRMRVNSHGSRGAEFDRRKAEGTLRIIALGDSFTFGQGVEDEEALPVRIGEALAPLRVPVEVLNFGVPGHSAPLSVALFERRLLDLEPDLVVLHVFGNDLEPGETSCPWFEPGGPTDSSEKNTGGMVRVLRGFVNTQMYTLRAIGILRRTLEGHGPQVRRVVPTGGGDGGTVAARGGPPSLEEQTASHERFITALRHLQDLAEEHEFLAAVVLLTDAQSFCRGPGPGCVSAHSLIANSPRGSVPVVLDMAATWGLLHSRQDSFIPGEGHFTVAANKLMGDRIGNKLLSWPDLVTRAAARRPTPDEEPPRDGRLEASEAPSRVLNED